MLEAADIASSMSPEGHVETLNLSQFVAITIVERISCNELSPALRVP